MTLAKNKATKKRPPKPDPKPASGNQKHASSNLNHRQADGKGVLEPGLSDLVNEAKTLEQPESGSAAAQTQTANDESLKASAEMTAVVVAEFVETIVTQIWPAAKYEEGQRAAFRERLTPLVMKYNGNAPPWVKRWKEEIELSAFMSLTAYGTWQQIRAEKVSDDGKESESNTTQ